MRISYRQVLFVIAEIGLVCALASCSGVNWFNSKNTKVEAQEQAQYRAMDRRPPAYQQTKRKCVHNAHGQEVCGYDCKVSGNEAQCAESAKERCVIGPNGHISCGYDCKVSHSMAACGKYLYDNCVADHMGHIVCGNNCSEREDGNVICGK